MKKFIAIGTIILVVGSTVILGACSKDNKVSSTVETEMVNENKSTDETGIDEQVDEVIFNEKRTDIYDSKGDNHENMEQDMKEKEELINNFSQRLQDTQSTKVMYGDFLDDDHYVYVVRDQIDEGDKIVIAYLNDENVELLFKGGDLDGEHEPIKPIRQIHKLFINRLDNWENPNVCVFRKNEKYTQVQIFEVNKEGKGVRYVGFCRRDNKTGEYSGDERYKNIIDSSFTPDYINK